MSLRRAAPLLVCLNLLLLAGLLPLFNRSDLPAQQDALRRNGGAGKGQLQLQWVRHSPAPLPAWPDQPKLHYDIVDKPVISGTTVFVGSSRTDSIAVLDM